MGSFLLPEGRERRGIICCLTAVFSFEIQGIRLEINQLFVCVCVCVLYICSEHVKETVLLIESCAVKVIS